METSHGIGKLVVVGPVGKVKSGSSGAQLVLVVAAEENGPSSAQEKTRLPVWSTALERSPKPR